MPFTFNNCLGSFPHPFSREFQFGVKLAKYSSCIISVSEFKQKTEIGISRKEKKNPDVLFKLIYIVF